MYQSITVIGNLGRDPEMKFSPSGKAVTSFSIADTRQYKNGSGELVKETTWFRVEVWGNQAEACNTYLKKGSLVLVEGRMKADINTGNPRIYQKKDQSWASSFEIQANNVKFLSKVEAKQAAPEEEDPF